MPTAANCRARADEAERLARLVSYERDRERLLRQAQEWREKADALETEAAAAPAEPSPSSAGRLRRWLGLR